MNKTKTLRLFLLSLLTVIFLNPAQSEAKTNPQPSLVPHSCAFGLCHFQVGNHKLLIKLKGVLLPSLPGHCIAEENLYVVGTRFMTRKLHEAKEIRLSDLGPEKTFITKLWPDNRYKIHEARVLVDGLDLSKLLVKGFYGVNEDQARKKGQELTWCQ